MDSRELWFRAGERALTLAERFQYSLRSPRWARERLSSLLSPVSSELSRAQHALDRHDWRVAANALRAHFTRRPSRFPINPDRRASIAASIREQFPDSVHDARDRADRLLAGSCDLLGYRDVSIGSPDHIDWHLDPVHQRRPPLRFWASVPYLDPATGDHKIIWETNRHQYWLTLGRAAWLTGDRRYSDAFKTELTSWLHSNPPLAGVNWASMLELGFRSISWIWSLHFFVALDDQTSDSTWLIDLLIGVDAQLNHIGRHLSRYFSPNTHLLGEGLALYVGGLVLPELRGASRWTALGRQILLEEAHRQVNADGGHAELSTHYHRYALDFYLFALSLARLSGDACAREFAEVTSRLATFCRAMATDAGVLPTIGDDDGGSLFPICGRPAADASDSLSQAAALLHRPELAVGDPPEETLWMLGGDRTQLQWPDTSLAPASTLFADTGYAVLRRGAALAIVDVGRHGFLNGGHAHADALSVVMSIDGRPLLVDPGTSTYTMDPERRNLYRSTAMHNTATIDGRPQSIPAAPFHWRSSAAARVRLWRSAPAFDFLEAEHDGYAPHVHRRSVLRIGSEIWFIADHVLGEGEHEVAIHWHLDPSWQLQHSDGGVVSVLHHDGVSASIASTATCLTHTKGGDLGWHAPVYGQHRPALTLTARQTGLAPFSVLTVISAGTVARNVSVQRVPVTVDDDDSRHRLAVTGDFEEGRFIALFGTETAHVPREARPLQTVELGGDAFHTDARIAVLGLSVTHDPLCLTLIDASRARWTGRSPFSLGPFTSAADLHLDRVTVSRLSHKSESSASIDRMEPTTCAE